MNDICGLIGLAGAPANGAQLEALLTARRLATRDWRVVHVGLEAALGYRPRLAPARQDGIARLDGGLGIVADARLDNRDELLAALGDRGAASSESDAELILRAYRRWGEGGVERLLGDFAFAIWDRERRRLVCARDPLGVRTLHYATLAGRIVFASSPEQLLGHPLIGGHFDEEAVALFLAGGAAPADRTMFREIRCLPPAHRLVAGAGRLEVERYWDGLGNGLAAEPLRLGRPEEYADRFRELFALAVSARLQDVEGEQVAIAMSGGLDSTSVAAMVHQLRRQNGSGPAPLACSLVFDRLGECDERDYIAAMRRELGIEVESVVADRRETRLGAGGPIFESPLLTGWEGSFGELLGRIEKRGIGVLLTGHGGDEVLTGSPLAYLDRLCRGELAALVELVRDGRAAGRSCPEILGRWVAAPLVPRRLRDELAKIRRSTSVPAWIDQRLVRRTRLRERLRGEPGQLRTGARSRQSLHQLLVASSFHPRATQWYELQAAPFGIEVRHPFLDRRLVEFALALPGEELFRGPALKPLLRKGMHGLLPESVRLRRDKSRLGSYLDHVLQRQPQGWFKELLDSSLGVELGFLDGPELRRALEACDKGRGGPSHRLLLSAIGLELWLRRRYRVDRQVPEMEGSTRQRQRAA